MESMDVIDKEKCTGCMACKNACPRNAITIKEENDGFLYPKINKEYCSNCNLCKKVCPVENKLEENKNDIEVYAAKNNDDNICLKSSSGGIFTLITNYILSQNGVVFGARFNENFEVVHDWTDNKNNIDEFRRSKYLQSKIGDSYKKAKEFLIAGRKVLFTGTPCQVEGLLTFLGKEYDNLYTQDIICHGVPSPKVWKKYLEYKKTIYNEQPKKVNFRRKDISGWNNYKVHIKYNSIEENLDVNESFYMNMFLYNYDLRNTCYNCNFKKVKRNSDITVADFWGIKDVNPEMYNENGVSALLINSKKGKEIFKNIKKHITYSVQNIDEIKINNPSYIKSSEYNEKRKEFFEDLDNLEIEELINKYSNGGK